MWSNNLVSNLKLKVHESNRLKNYKYEKERISSFEKLYKRQQLLSVHVEKVLWLVRDALECATKFYSHNRITIKK